MGKARTGLGSFLAACALLAVPAYAEPTPTFGESPVGRAPCPEGMSRTDTVATAGFESGIPQPNFANGWGVLAGADAPEGTRTARSVLDGSASDPEDYFFLTPAAASGATFLALASRGTQGAGQGVVAVNSFARSVPASSTWTGQIFDITTAVDDEGGWLSPWLSHERVSGVATRWDLDNVQIYSCADNATARLSGTDRYNVSAAIADTFPAGTEVAYVARGDNFPDALGAVSVAARAGAPIILVRPDEIPAPVPEALSRLNPQRIVILGGTASVQPQIAAQLATYTSGTVTRIDGPDRYAVSAKLSRTSFPDGAEQVYVVSGEVFADALSAAPLASGPREGAPTSPLLMTRGEALSPVIAEELARLAPARVTVVGGPATVAESVLTGIAHVTGAAVNRISGDDRYAVSAQVAAAFGPDDIEGSYLAAGANYPDAIMAAAVSGARHEPLLLTFGHGLPSVVRDRLEWLRESRGTIVGGPASVAAIVRDDYGRTLP